MTELDVIGIGAWSECFANWPAMHNGFQTGQWSQGSALAPEAIPPRERRRAPHSVKMAVEVMGQACEMASMSPADPAVVFASAMGDMQITDAMCGILADRPELVSPTRFHNSVHNAAIGYWSIATGSHQPSTAVAGYHNSGALGLLEAGIQCGEDALPVMFVCQEGAAPRTLHLIRPSDQPLALALLLVPAGTSAKPLTRLTLEMTTLDAETESATSQSSLLFPIDFGGNPTASLLPVFASLADVITGKVPRFKSCVLPVNDHCALRIGIHAPSQVIRQASEHAS